MNTAMQHNVHNSHAASKDGTDQSFFEVTPPSQAEHWAKQARAQADFDARHKQKAKKTPSPPVSTDRPRASFETEATLLGEGESKDDAKQQRRSSSSFMSRITGAKKTN